MGDKRMRLIRAENDIDELRAELKDIRETLSEATDFGEEFTSQSAEIVNLSRTVDSFNAQLRQLFDNTRFLNSDGAKVWLSEMDTICRQVKDSVASIHDWQNQMAKDFSVSLIRLGRLQNTVDGITNGPFAASNVCFENIDRALRDLYSKLNKVEDACKAHEASRLRLASLTDDRIRDLERELAEATEHSRGVVSRMEQLETRLKILESSQVRVTLGPNRTVHIPEAIHWGGPLSVKMESSKPRPSEIRCEDNRS